MKNETLIFSAVGLAAALLFLRRPAMASGATFSVHSAAPWVPKSGALRVGEVPYAPARTSTAATLPYGFNNTTPGGEFINGFI